jgi:hypothetical protein
MASPEKYNNETEAKRRPGRRRLGVLHGPLHPKTAVEALERTGSLLEDETFIFVVRRIEGVESD